MVVYARPNRTGGNRLGITVGVKVGGAVVRNRTRRLIRESYRLGEHRLKTGYDIVAVARVRCAGADFRHVDASLFALLKSSASWPRRYDAPGGRFGLIAFYRRRLSPLKRYPTCRFIPTCSEYAFEAVSKYGCPGRGVGSPFCAYCAVTHSIPADMTRGGSRGKPCGTT